MYYENCNVFTVSIQTFLNNRTAQFGKSKYGIGRLTHIHRLTMGLLESYIQRNERPPANRSPKQPEVHFRISQNFLRLSNVFYNICS